MISILDNCFVVAVCVCVCFFVCSFILFVCLIGWFAAGLVTSLPCIVFDFFLSFGPFLSDNSGKSRYTPKEIV